MGKRILPNLLMVSRGSNAYVLDAGDDGVVVIDTGLRFAAGGAITNTIKYDLKRPMTDLNHILQTHADIDHIGNLSHLVKISDAKVYATGNASASLYQRKSPAHLPFFVAPVADVTYNMLLGRHARVDQFISEGDTIDVLGGIDVYDTPGHTPDHVSFYWREQKILFSGDLLFGIPNLMITPGLFSYSKDYAVDSARKILDLDIRMICFGHGAPLDLEDKKDQATFEKFKDKVLA